MPYQQSGSRRTFMLMFFIIVALIYFLKDLYPMKNIRSLLIERMRPIQEVTFPIIKEAKESTIALLQFHKLKEENRELNKQLFIFEQERLQHEELRLENERLRNLLNYKLLQPFAHITAQIIGKDSNNWYKGLIVNKGRNHHIKPDQAVLCPQGLVGKTVEVFANTSKIMVLTDINSHIGVMNHRSRDQGVLRGSHFESCTLNFLSRNADIQQGDLILTSGQNSFYPKGILVGEVLNIQKDQTRLFKYATVIPSVDTLKLEEVLIAVPLNKRFKTKSNKGNFTEPNSKTLKKQESSPQTPLVNPPAKKKVNVKPT